MVTTSSFMSTVPTLALLLSSVVLIGSSLGGSGHRSRAFPCCTAPGGTSPVGPPVCVLRQLPEPHTVKRAVISMEAAGAAEPPRQGCCFRIEVRPCARHCPPPAETSSRLPTLAGAAIDRAEPARPRGATALGDGPANRGSGPTGLTSVPGARIRAATRGN